LAAFSALICGSGGWGTDLICGSGDRIEELQQQQTRGFTAFICGLRGWG